MHYVMEEYIDLQLDYISPVTSSRRGFTHTLYPATQVQLESTIPLPSLL